MRRGRGCRREFPVSPDCAIFEVLLLPDGYGALECVDGEAASVKSGSAVRRADGDEDARIADLQSAEEMADGHAVNAVFLVELDADLTHLSNGHGLVGFIVQIEGPAVVGLIADETVES